MPEAQRPQRSLVSCKKTNHELRERAETFGLVLESQGKHSGASSPRDVSFDASTRDELRSGS